METIVSNKQVDLDGLTALESMDMKALSPKYRRLNIQISFAFWGGLAAVLGLVLLQPFFELPAFFNDHAWIAISVLLFLMTWSVIYHYFADPKKKYAIREHDIHFQTGWIFQKRSSQPIMRIQHIEIERGPIERKAGLATLQVFSAGGANHTFEIPGLVHDKAIELRQFILDHKDVREDG